MYWILFVVLLNSLSAERQTMMSDWISEVFNNTRVSTRIINSDTEIHREGFMLDNMTSSGFTFYFNVNNESIDISSTQKLKNLRSSNELGYCVYYDINGSLTAREAWRGGGDWIRKLNVTLDSSSMSYD